MGLLFNVPVPAGLGEKKRLAGTGKISVTG